MKTIITTLLALLLCAPHLRAQDDNVKLLAQSVDGKAVKLFWFIQHWNSTYTGFDVRRKEGLQPWVKLNPEPVLPGISAKKKLSAAGLTRYEESLVKAKQYRMIKARTLHETEYAKYLQQLNKDDNTLREISPIMAENYDVALMNGFGYVDNTPVNKTVYTYGLFIQGTDKLLATVSWNYGEIPDLDVVRELTSFTAGGSNRGVKIYWVADTNKMRAAHVAGFNIYREGIRLNTIRVIAPDSSEPGLFSWYDKSAVNTNPIQYSVGAESIFDIEGIIKSYLYDPADHPKEYKNAEVSEISSLGYYFKDGTSIKWNFPKEYERYLKGFEIEKDNVPAGYKKSSELLDPAARAYVDKTPSQANGYIRVRVKAVYKDRSVIPGKARVFYYFPITEPMPPQNFTAKSKVTGKEAVITFNWDAALPGDSVTDVYKLYTYSESDEKFVPLNGELTHSNSYSYTVNHGTATTLRFCATALSKGRSESHFSDTVSVRLPSLELPAPTITQVTTDNNKARIEWQYPDIPDVKGFRLSQNGKQIANESALKKDVHTFTTDKLEEGASYEFSIDAVSDNGILSDHSATFHVVFTQTSGK